ncbi:hypothetical protein HGRIS_003131 [Hohenbuehelia grisea]|uniref:AB hydrolase-1 domain-containing protein n=1 Tax=Hohenbuehelia grisea TaxID=104357 RepID=A0ABR3JNI9_9AGAR
MIWRNSLLVCALTLLVGHGGAKRVGTAHYRGYFYVGGEYSTQNQATISFGQIYVEHLTPASGVRQKYPLVFVHGAGLTATTWLNTPDGREGWADYFLGRGFEVYLLDQPSRGRSPYQKSLDGSQSMINAESVEKLFTAPAFHKSWAYADLHTQWPGTGRRGDATFDNFYTSLVPLLSNPAESGAKNQHALAALLRRVEKPVILVTHSQSGLFGWPAADAEPKKVKAIIALEPGGPPFQPDTMNQPSPNAPPAPSLNVAHPWGLSEVPMTYDPPITNISQFKLEQVDDGPGYKCVQQAKPAHRWINLVQTPVLVVTGEASWHAAFDDCTVEFICQAGVKVHFARLQDFDIHGNGHMFFIEKNNLQIASEVVEPWIKKISQGSNLSRSDLRRFKVCPGLTGPPSPK